MPQVPSFNKQPYSLPVKPPRPDSPATMYQKNVITNILKHKGMALTDLRSTTYEQAAEMIRKLDKG